MITKFKDNTIRRKCKSIVLDTIIDFTNAKINEKDNNHKDNDKNLIKLKIINKNRILTLNVNEEKLFMFKTLAEILCEPISTKYLNRAFYTNKRIIQRLLNENDDNRRNFFKKLFNLNFKDCLEHFSGKINIDVLNSLKCFNDIKNSQEELKKIKVDINDEEYLEVLNFYLNHYENIIFIKRSRITRAHN